MGKYSHLTPNLPRYVDPNVKHRDRVNQCKRELLDSEPFKSREPGWLTLKYRDVKDRLDQIAAVRKRLNVELTAITELMEGAYQQEGMTSVRLSDGALVSVNPEPYASVQDREAFRLWCIADGLERSLQLPWGTTNSMVKDFLIAGKALPDGLSVFAKTKINYRRAKNGVPVDEAELEREFDRVNLDEEDEDEDM